MPIPQLNIQWYLLLLLQVCKQHERLRVMTPCDPAAQLLVQCLAQSRYSPKIVILVVLLSRVICFPRVLVLMDSKNEATDRR